MSSFTASETMQGGANLLNLFKQPNMDDVLKNMAEFAGSLATPESKVKVEEPVAG